MLLYIIRHGDPDYGRDCLTELGKAQALAVGKRLSNSGIDEVYASPMGRARETAQPLCMLTKKEMQILPWAHELGREVQTPFPNGVNKSVSVVPNAYYAINGNQDIGVADSFTADGFKETVGMETKAKWVWSEADAFLAQHGYVREEGAYRMVAPNDKRIAIFCHGAMGRCLMSHLLNIPIHTFWGSFSVSHTGVSIFEFRNYPDGITAANCLCFDDLSHIYAERLPYTFCGRVKL